MYIPTDAHSLSEETKPVFKVALQARGGQGKTWSALTFPNPIVLNFDKNLQAFAGRGDIHQVPFWEDKFVDSIIKRGNTLDQSIRPDATTRPNRRDALIIWLNREGPKFTSEQTIVLDSWSKVQDSFDQQERIEPHYTKKGEVDEFAFWANKLEWSTTLCELLGSLACNVVVTFHEMYITDEGGKVIINKVIPLQQGKFVNKVSLYFSDWFRCLFLVKGTPKSDLPAPLQELIKDTILQEDMGFWQTKSSLIVDCKTRIVGAPQFIRADYNELIRLYETNKNKTQQIPK